MGRLHLSPAVNGTLWTESSPSVPHSCKLMLAEAVTEKLAFHLNVLHQCFFGLKCHKASLLIVIEEGVIRT